MAVYVISDCHFGHNNILKFRDQFDSIEQHDWTIANNILNMCGKRDTLYMLGDVCIYKDAWKHVQEISAGVEFLHICLGNHDLERKGCPTLDDYQAVCKSVFGMKKYKSAWFTHAPIHLSELRGKMNIHGHIHSEVIDDERYFNASCENVNYYPVNVADILGTKALVRKGGMKGESN